MSTIAIAPTSAAATAEEEVAVGELQLELPLTYRDGGLIGRCAVHMVDEVWSTDMIGPEHAVLKLHIQRGRRMCRFNASHLCSSHTSPALGERKRHLNHLWTKLDKCGKHTALAAVIGNISTTYRV